MWHQPQCKQPGQEILLLLCCFTAGRSTGKNSNRCVFRHERVGNVRQFPFSWVKYRQTCFCLLLRICVYQSRVPGTVIPLCAAQCERMFNTTRTPGEETGKLFKPTDFFFLMEPFFANVNGILRIEVVFLMNSELFFFYNTKTPKTPHCLQKLNPLHPQMFSNTGKTVSLWLCTTRAVSSACGCTELVGCCHPGSLSTRSRKSWMIHHPHNLERRS